MMHEKINCTTHKADFGICQDKEGMEIVSAVLKASYLFGEKGEVTEAEGDERLPVFQSDRYYESPDNSSLEYATDIVPEKIGTDIAVNGSVYGWGMKSVEAGFSVNNSKKTFIAYGVRRMDTFIYASIEKPKPFDRLPLRYELSYGGSFKTQDGRLDTYPYNPLGRGYAPRAEEGMLLPRFEYEKSPFKNIQSRPYPAGLGFVPTHWHQRARFAGTFDQKWHDERRPLFPEDFDSRFYNAVSLDQVFVPKLAGGEKVTLLHLHPRYKTVSFDIPRGRFTCVFKIKDQRHEILMDVDTLLIEPDIGRFSLSYRASLPVGNDFRYVKAIIFKEAA